MNYIPINWHIWDRSGEGKNILHLLTQDEQKIWQAALPYQDSRPNDRGHAEIVVYFALQLLEHVKAHRDVVLPAAVLHDIGWSQLPEDVRNWFKDFNHPNFKNVNDPTIRKQHQDESVRLARDIYSSLGLLLQPDVLHIIGDHDTRLHFDSIDAHVMGDADVLWRFTVLQCENYMFPPAECVSRMRKKIDEPRYLLTTAGRAIASAELKNMEKYYG